ncbi:MAG: ATP-binding cassette domain-containing protein [Ktedonobacteraceae bacterium]
MASLALPETRREIIVQVKRLSKSYPIPDGKLAVLHDLSFEVKRGEFLAISGPSGSGKTTLLALLGALDRPDEGEIWLDDIPVHTQRGMAAARFRRQKVGFVFQLFYLLPNLTALENVMAPLLPFRHTLDFDLRERAETLLTQVGLSHRLAHTPARLSGGEQQRVAIARALINRPAVVLADEPTGNLDPATGVEILEVLRAQQEAEHQTLILVTHDPAVAARADRRIRLQTSTVGLEIESMDEIVLAPRSIFVPAEAETGGQISSGRQRRVSRRVLIAGGLGIGVAALAAAGGIVWFARYASSSSATLGKTLLVYHGHKSAVNAVVWAQEADFIASASAPLTAQQWHAASAQQREAAIARIQAGSLDSSAQVWNPTSGRLMSAYHGQRGGVTTITLSPDSKHAASGGLADGTVQLWNPQNGQPSGKLPAKSASNDSSVWAIAWSPDGTRIASGDALHHVQVWDPLTGKILLTYQKHAGPITALAWSPDGNSLASASDDQTVQVWDATSGKQIQTYTDHAQGVRTLLWAADGQSIFSAGADHLIWVWDAANGNPYWLYKGHTAPINAMQWSPDNSKLLSASDDKTVRLWENWQSGTGKIIYTYQEHTAPALSASWSGDGTKIASGSSDKMVRIWIASQS